MNYLPLRTIVCVISLLISQTSLAQQWQLGHQPSQYSVPQYHPAMGGSYPLIEEPSASQEPRPHNPDDAMPNLGTAPRATADPKGSYPLHGTSPATPQHDQPPARTVMPLQDPLAGEIPLGEGIIDSRLVTPPQPTPSFPAQSGPSLVKRENHTGAQSGSFALDYSIYRDLNTYPIDPRKPCNDCVDPQMQAVCRCQWPGKKGRPYQDREPGTCRCSSASNKNRPHFSYNWPAPFSGILKTHLSSGSNCTASRKPINDCFDRLVDFKLIDYKRADNGYCGRGSDPYGCLGESRVAGVGFRQPGDSAVQRR